MINYSQIDYKNSEFTENNNIIKFNKNEYNFQDYIKKMYNDYFNLNFELEDIHVVLNNNILSDEDKLFYKQIPLFGVNDRKTIFIKIFHNYFDTCTIFKEKYYNFINNFIKPTFFKGEDFLLVQKTPNIRLHLPNCTNIGKRNTDPGNDIIGLHSDSEFGHSENEFNFILPITNMFDTNSLYFEPYINSNIPFEMYNNLRLDQNNIAILYLNKLKHYNKINKTNKTRISFDFRIIPFSKYKQNNNISETFKLNLDIDGYFIKI
jgi:hypothetical protein